ncbi:MAG: YaaL family protein [Clostridiales bacterium]|nr:YaaL family protein [Clostridiales bacterium]
MKKREYSEEYRRLRTQINRTRSELEAVENHFGQATDPVLIDCYIYERKAIHLRYQFLLRQFKHLENT